MKKVYYKLKKEKNMILFIFCGTFLFGLVAHAYCYFNMFYSHDSLMIYQKGDNNWQTSLGRFLNPLYLKIRGYTYPSFLIGILSLCYLSIAIYGIIKILKIKNKILICLSIGVLTTNATLIFSNATFMPWVDMYMLALLFSVAGVYVSDKFKYGFSLGSLMMLCSLGLYQSYFQVAVFLSMIIIVKKIFDGCENKYIIVSGIKQLTFLVLGLILYYGILQTVLKITKIELSNSYNGISDVGNYNNISIFDLLYSTYKYPFIYYLNPETYHSHFMGILNIVLLIISLVLILKLVFVKKIDKIKIIILAFTILLMPFGMNIVYFISKKMEHSLMIYSFFIAYIFVCLLLQLCIDCRLFKIDIKTKIDKFYMCNGMILIMIIGCFLFNNVIYANKIYQKKELQYQATLSTMIRVIDRIEQLDGYVINQTPVVFVGNLENSILSEAGNCVKDIKGGISVGEVFSVTYESTYLWYLQNFLSYPIKFLFDTKMYIEMDEVKKMPAFPQKECCKMIDGVVVMKLS